MVVFLILAYFLLGMLISCIYCMLSNLDTSPWAWEADQKRMIFLIIETWPFMLTFWLVRETVKTIIWGISKLKK